MRSISWVRVGLVRKAAVAVFLIATRLSGAPQMATPSAASTPVGSAACQTCHEDLFHAFARSPHSVVETKDRHGWQGKACESCHGLGGAHAESAAAADIRNPAKLTASVADRACAGCHSNLSAAAGRFGGTHAQHQVSCVSCHAVHARGPAGMVVRQASTVNAGCSTCHATVWAQFQRPHRHRLPEGAMSCVDCHNPHGTLRSAAARTFAGNDNGCARCHGDKRGPFPFEHAPVRWEGCGSCHEAHGSVNPRMLTRQEVRFVCLECHANLPAANTTTVAQPVVGVVPPSVHDLRSPRYRNCTVCHQKIHGSYVDRSLQR